MYRVLPCENCKTHLEQGVLRCPSCGASDSAEKDYRKPKVNPWLIAFCFLFAPLAICSSCAPGPVGGLPMFILGCISGVAFIVLFIADHIDDGNN